MNPRTPSCRAVPREELAARVGVLYRSLAGWIRAHDDDAVRATYEEWGRKRFTQHVPISEIIYTVIVARDHLRRYARERGLEFDAATGEFFVRALYYLVRGYEMQATTRAV